MPIRNAPMGTINHEDDVWSLLTSLRASDSDPGVELQNSHICEHCKSTRLAMDEGHIICLSCGTISDRQIDEGMEWRYYGYEDSKSTNPTRCGMPINDLLPESSLGTIISSRGGDCYEMRIIRKFQMWNSMTYKERTLYNIFDMLTVNAVNNGIPSSILEEAKALYKQVSELKLARGDNRCGLIASSIYVSCKRNNVPRSAKEIAKIFNIKTTTMTKGCKMFQELMHLTLVSSTATDFIQRFASKISLNKEVKDLCAFVVAAADEHGIISENTPPSIAAGCIYFACQETNTPVEKKDLAIACDVSMVTISKCYKKLHTYREYLLPAAMLA